MEEAARLLGARCLRACQSGGLPIGGRDLLGKEGYSSAPGGLWHGLGLLAPFLLNQGKEFHDLLSFFPSWEGQGAMGYSGILLETVGEGLVPQGWALIKQREGVTDRPSRKDGEVSERELRAEGGPCSFLHFQKEKRKVLSVCAPGHQGQGQLRGQKKEVPGLECPTLSSSSQGRSELPLSADDS